MEHSFSPEQLRRVLGSSEAADAAKQGDHARAMELLRPVLNTEQAQALLRKLNG